MCVETCVKISDKSNKKWRSYSLCKLSSWVTQGVYKIGQAHKCREGWGGGTSVNYWLFSLEDAICYSYLLSCHAISRADWYGVVAKVSNNRDLTEWGCKICTPPPASQLASLSINSKVDWTGQKVDNLRNRWTYIAVFGLI